MPRPQHAAPARKANLRERTLAACQSHTETRIFRGQIRYVWICDFEIRSIDPQFRVEVCSSSIVTSLQVLDHRGCLSLVQKVRQLSKHFLSEITDLLVRPILRLSQREDGRQ